MIHGLLIHILQEYHPYDDSSIGNIILKDMVKNSIMKPRQNANNVHNSRDARCVLYQYDTKMIEIGPPWIINRSHKSTVHLPYTPLCTTLEQTHDDIIKWKHFPRYWPFVRGIHRSPVNSPHKGQWRGAFMFTLICARINGWVNTREAGDLRRYRAHYDVIVMMWTFLSQCGLLWAVVQGHCDIFAIALVSLRVWNLINLDTNNKLATNVPLPRMQLWHILASKRDRLLYCY